MKKTIFIISASLLFSNPTGMEKIDGNAHLKMLDGNTLHIFADDKSILHWDDFSIQENEKTIFFQPNEHASVLNRVTGDNKSLIFGKLEANGHLLLINPNGVIFGPNSSTETGSLTATTLDILNEQFVNESELRLHGDSKASIINLGRIETKCGSLILVGLHVENQGSLYAPNGTCGLGVSNEIFLIPDGNEKILIRVPMEEPNLEVGIDQSGTIEALEIELKSSGSAYAHAIRHSGKIVGKGLVEKEGKVFLVADRGTQWITGEISCQNSDETGGTIHILGEKIALTEKAALNTSGKFGGGEILIGGDLQGQNRDILNAEYVYVGNEVKVSNRCEEKGDGGKTIFWSDSYTRMYGEVDARGGDIEGNGGFIEVSGKKGFDYQGSCNRLAPNGKVGTLLLDPESDITVSLAATSNGAFNGSNVFIPTAAASNVAIGPGAGSLITELTLGNVTIQTTGVFGGPGASGDITIQNSFTTASANELTFNATRDIIVDPTLTLNHSGSLVFNSGRNMLLQSAITGPTNISVTTGGDLDLISTAAPGAQLPSVPTASFTDIVVGGNLNMSSTSASTAAIGNNTLLSFNLQVAGDLNMTGNMGFGGAQISTPFNTIVPTGIQINGNLNMVDNDSIQGVLFRFRLSALTDFFQVLGNVNVTSLNPAGFCRLQPAPFVDMITMVVGQTLTVDGMGAQLLVGGSGTQSANLSVENLIVQNDSRLTSLGGVSPTVNILAQDSITFANNALIERLGASYTLNLVVDNANPSLPGIGTGAFNMDATSRIILPIGNFLNIYTASQSQNMIDPLAIINGANFSPGPFNVDTAQEIWSTYYPSVLGSGTPFTFFYKEPAAIIFNPVVQQSKSIAQLEGIRDMLFFDEILFLESTYQARIASLTASGEERITPFWMRLKNYGTNLMKQVGDVLPQ